MFWSGPHNSKKTCGQTGKEGHKDVQRCWRTCSMRKDEERQKVKSFNPEEKVKHHSIPVLKGWLKNIQKLSLHKELQIEDKLLARVFVVL